MVKIFTFSQFPNDARTMMMLKIFIILCVVIDVYSFGYKSDSCDGCEYARIKRAKYYSSSPQKFYNRPPFSPPIRGPFSYTPPPGYTANDVGPPTPSNLRPFKVSKRPNNDGLGDEDLHNLFKYLSKKDLDKIVEYVNEKDRYMDRYREESDRSNNYPLDFNYNDNLSYTDQMYDSRRLFNSPNKKAYENRYYSSDDDSSNSEFFTNKQSKEPLRNYKAYSQESVQANEFKDEGQFSFLDAYIQKEIGSISPNNNNIDTDSMTMQEEELPKPINLRTNDHEVSYTNDVISVVKPETFSYKLENFAELPLMGHENSKLHTVSSYSVPHYYVTGDRPTKQTKFSSQFSSSSQFSKPSDTNIPEVEPAPPASTAKEQSDAHLKAIKIWTHKSKGTAYTLHDDGTLTLEIPSRP